MGCLFSPDDIRSSEKNGEIESSIVCFQSADVPVLKTMKMNSEQRKKHNKLYYQYSSVYQDYIDTYLLHKHQCVERKEYSDEMCSFFHNKFLEFQKDLMSIIPKIEKTWKITTTLL